MGDQDKTRLAYLGQGDKGQLRLDALDDLCKYLGFTYSGRGGFSPFVKFLVDAWIDGNLATELRSLANTLDADKNRAN